MLKYFSFSDSMLVLVLAALLPPFYLLMRVYRLDRIEKEPVKLLFFLFLLGAVSTIPAIALELGLGNLLVTIFNQVRLTDFTVNLYYLIDNLICVALVEEGLKFVFLRFGTWKNKSFNYRFDGIVYAIFVSLGFATAENVLYVTSNGMGNAVMRALTAIPGHCIFGIYMGTYYGWAKMYDRRGMNGRRNYELFKALAVPTLLHGIYDYSLTIDSEYAFYGFLIYIIVLDVVASKHIRRSASLDESITYASDREVGIRPAAGEQKIESLADLKDALDHQKKDEDPFSRK
ncbi:MAG: PrsW family glutamic-type intramembrane protease [Erysipelotrichaceae bacterium]|nr:PrsW family glutamic-type intramembrane protease [Erysipelotrichaceae bacterium]